MTTLADLVAALPDAAVVGDANVRIDDVCHDSREASPDALFFCLPGANTDGHDHAPQAVAAGAVALVVERRLDLDVAQVVVPSVRRAMGPVSAAFFGHPSSAFRLVGVTGTNGKTTTTFFLERCFEALGWKSGLIGTVETHIAGDVYPVKRTTPEPPDLQRLFARMRAAGVGGAAIEASSEGIAQHRVDGTRFACGVFTNLSQDHLNFHGTMEAYFRAKAMLFEPERTACAALNLDDAYGRRLADEVAIPWVGFAVERDAAVRAEDVVLRGDGATFTVVADGERHAARIALPGRYNVANALAAIAALHAMGLPVAAAVEGVGRLDGVPGRLQRIPAPPGVTVLVDYAHTADSLENVLRAARELVDGGRLISVFGCGGDRDRGKRPAMGRASTSLADLTVVTSDNPRSEDPLAIIAEIEPGARDGGGAYVVEPDRRAAIRSAIAQARPGDVVVIAGKGHETGQQIGSTVIPFDDRVVAREAIEEVFGSDGSAS